MFFGGIGKIKSILFVGLIICAMFLFKNIAQTETQTGGVNVNMTVPVYDHCNNGVQDADETGVDCGGADCGSCGSPVTYDIPEISLVSKTEYINSVKMIWSVNTFGNGLNTTSIAYSIGVDFASSTEVMVSGTQFVANISDLQPDTTYNFRIFAKDNNGYDAVPEQGQFKTLIGNVVNLTILARPEKRVEKVGGNFAVTADLIFFDQITNSILFTTSSLLDKSGTTTINNMIVPAGNNLVAILKTNSHLAKRLNGVDTTKGNLSLDFTDSNRFELKAGDVMGSLEETDVYNPFVSFLISINRDDSIDALDISRLSNAAKVQSTEEELNFNLDDIVDSLDISIFDFNSRNYPTGDISVQ